MLFDINKFTSLFPIVLSSLGLTSEIAIFSLIGTLFLSVIIAIIRYYKIPVLTQFFNVFITIFRATPLVVELFMIFFALPCIFPPLKAMTPFQATVLSLIFNTSAFMAESFRAEACY